MPYAICVEQFESADPDHATDLILAALDKAGLTGQSDYVSRVVILATPAFSEVFEEMLQHVVAATHCMSVWGGCVAGIWTRERVVSTEATLLVAVFDQTFEHHETTPNFQICLTDSDYDQSCFNAEAQEPSTTEVQADGLGLLSYGANYAKLPRAEQGRLSNNPFNHLGMKVDNPLWLNSEGLEFLSEPMEVTAANGLFLLEIDGRNPMTALNCPSQQTRPVGLRLQIIHEQGEAWVPVLNLVADGTIGLAAPVSTGQKVRLARRLTGQSDALVAKFQKAAQGHFGKKAPELGLMIAGMERTALCHPELSEFEAVANAFPETDLIGIVGQAAWLERDETVLHPPRNNRLALCLFNPESNDV